MNEKGEVGTRFSAPHTVLIPLYKKIRVPFSVVHDNLLYLKDTLTTIVDKYGIDYLSSTIKAIEWDILLTTVNDLKKDIKDKSNLKGEYKLEILLSGMPRFIWRVIAALDGVEQTEFLFDATDINHGKLFYGAIEYDSNFSKLFRLILDNCNDEILGTIPKEERLVIECIKEWFHTTPVP